MGLPIKSNSTQEGCTPTSSNCVIWQGPDIPCINLCNGDTVSDVIAKLAEKLCTILDQTQLSAYDISCFNPVYPTPQSFTDLIQVLIDKICALENITPANGAASGCPDDCFVTVATCLQTTDFLGNTITSLSLKDYTIKLGNEICGILTQISSLQTGFADLEARVAYIEANCCNTTVSITVPSSCLSGNTGIPIVNFVVALETAFCDLQTDVGDIPGAIATQCIANSDPQLSVFPAITPTMSAIFGWNTSPGTLSQAVENLWLALCDARTAISTLQTTVATLQTDLAACCSGTCADVIWSFAATGIRGLKFVDLSFSGSVPPAFDYCGGGSTTAITVTDAYGNSGVFNEDVLAAVISSGNLDLDISSIPSIEEQSIYYEVEIDLCVENDTVSCNNRRTVTFYNAATCSSMNPSITSPAPGNALVSWTSLSAPSTTYTITLYSSPFSPIAPYGIPAASFAIAYSVSGPRTAPFTGLVEGAVYLAVITATQNGRSVDCTIGYVQITEAP
jgi:hypothetical protein